MPTKTAPTPTMMELASGSYFDFKKMDESIFTLGDVAQGLANTCRFSGQTTVFYSVAEHAVGVAERLEAQGYGIMCQLAGLHHDDSEAFITDVPRPIKILLPDYMKLEKKVMEVVLNGLGLSDLDIHDPAVKEADDWMLAQEAGEMLPSRGEPWSVGWTGKQRDFGLSPGRAQEAWLRQHHYLVQLTTRGES